MMKKLLLILLFIPFITNAQEVISSSGDYFSNANGSVAFTVGEIAIETISTGSNNITQGFHQNDLTVASVNDINNISINVYPNPTRNLIKLDITEFFGLKYKIYDLRGRLLKNKLIETKITDIDLSNMTDGLYLVAIYNSKNQKINTYKIIKN